jgi:hypothetical protein
MSETDRSEYDAALRRRLNKALASISHEAAARLSGCNRESVRRWRTRSAAPACFLAAVAAELGVNGHWLLTGEGKMMRNEEVQETLRDVPTGVLLQEIAKRIERRAGTEAEISVTNDATKFIHRPEDRAARHRRDR